MMIMLPEDREERINFISRATIRGIAELTRYNYSESLEVILTMLKEAIVRTNRGEREETETLFLEMIASLKDKWEVFDKERIAHKCDNCNKECDCMHVLCREEECKTCKCTYCTSCISILNKR